jgi:hypothetical protein
MNKYMPINLLQLNFDFDINWRHGMQRKQGCSEIQKLSQ